MARHETLSYDQMTIFSLHRIINIFSIPVHVARRINENFTKILYKCLTRTRLFNQQKLLSLMECSNSVCQLEIRFQEICVPCNLNADRYQIKSAYIESIICSDDGVNTNRQ